MGGVLVGVQTMAGAEEAQALLETLWVAAVLTGKGLQAYTERFEVAQLSLRLELLKEVLFDV